MVPEIHPKNPSVQAVETAVEAEPKRADDWAPPSSASRRDASLVQMRANNGVTAQQLMAFRKQHRVQESAPEAIAQAGTAGAGQGIPHRAAMERSFGRDFGHVRAFVGTGASREAADALGAHAYAVGDAVAFRDASPSEALVAHELTHIIQQAERRGSLPQRGIDRSGEAEAEAVERAVAAGRAASTVLGPGTRSVAVRGAVQRAPALKGKAGSATTGRPDKVEQEVNWSIPLGGKDFTYPPGGTGLYIYLSPTDLTLALSAAADVKEKGVTSKAAVSWGVDLGAAFGSKHAGIEAYLEGQPRISAEAFIAISEKGPAVDAQIQVKADVYAGVRLDRFNRDYRFQLTTGTFVTVSMANFLLDDPNVDAVQVEFCKTLQQMWKEFTEFFTKIVDLPDIVLEAAAQWGDVERPGALGERLDEQHKAYHAAQRKETKLLGSRLRNYESEFPSFRAAKNLAVLATLRDTYAEWWPERSKEMDTLLNDTLRQYMTDLEQVEPMAKSEVEWLISEGIEPDKAKQLGKRYASALTHPGKRYTLDLLLYEHDNTAEVNEAMAYYHTIRDQALQEAKSGAERDAHPSNDNEADSLPEDNASAERDDAEPTDEAPDDSGAGEGASDDASEASDEDTSD